MATSSGDVSVEVFTCDGLPAVAARVSPGARRNRVCGVIAGRLKVQVAAPPEEGRANKALIHLLASWLGIRQNAVEIVAGASSRDKVITFKSIDAESLRERLHDALRGLSGDH